MGAYTTRVMSPPCKATETIAKLDKFRHKDKDEQVEDGNPSSSGMESSAPEARILGAISVCQTTLTTKIEEVKVYISLISQDMHKLWDRVLETKHRLSHAEDAIPSLQVSSDQVSHHIAQLQKKPIPREGQYPLPQYSDHAFSDFSAGCSVNIANLWRSRGVSGANTSSTPCCSQLAFASLERIVPISLRTLKWL